MKQYADIDEFKFDLVAKKDDKTILVRVKPDMAEEPLNEILVSTSKAGDFKGAHIFLAMNILRFPEVFHNGAITRIVSDHAKEHQVGIFLVDEDDQGDWKIWLLPPQFLSRPFP